MSFKCRELAWPDLQFLQTPALNHRPNTPNAEILCKLFAINDEFSVNSWLFWM
jgi:hypothetical protein